MVRRSVSVVVLTAVIVGLAATAAYAVSGAGFTTTSDGTKVNANQYQKKCDVYINGGPNNGTSNLTDGTYFFAVLAPGGQPDPNDGGAKNLSDDFDARSNRRFTVSGGHIVTNLGSHESHLDPSTTTVSNDILIQLCNFADTPNPGGVYILAICLLPSPSSTATVTPRDCKYDAFKIKKKNVGTDLAATKTAVPSLTRTHLWTITKDVDKTSVTTSASTATFNYTVTVTHTGTTDSAWTVTGQIQVFNVNSSQVTGVSVTDATNVGGTCIVASGPTTIDAADSATYNYTCTFASNPGSGINTATITWNQASINSPNSSTTATAPFDFASATVNNVNSTIHIDDTIVNATLGTTVASGQIGTCTSATAPCTFNYQRVLAVPANGCYRYDNTATIRETGQNDSESVTVCRQLVTGAFTMGFWRNRNGQAKIATANNVPGSGLCAYLDQYPNVLPDFNGGAGCSDSYVQNYVTNVINLAEASGTGEPMFKGQFLATALSAFFNSTLANTGVQVPGSLLAEADNCLTVAQLLVRADSLYNTLKANKTNLMTVKNVFDGINNNNWPTC